MFCPKCGKLLTPREVDGKRVMGCDCGHVHGGSAVVREEIKKDERKIEVADADVETLPLVEEKCPECDHDHAYFWEIQTRAGDEAATKFYKCEKCKHVWRDYS
ncbi:transcription factor S [Candidatus Woesearchaeota archaeon]|jgi:transcription factor S|nr:transcription factor S [Candidatus Woesearchaeota archaeon]MBT7928891.1 transcription factor S [Candidatus Peregrinibacteria bacterium]MBT3537631.1 transcription factor S [Candidatus Woesearchaeota archaeon]MBT4698435.1 transcription factor S [Candidatus Woesearchaeota archaeon]MBT4716656.1 transcription factor S [Candidatus Woesearchaeota archaeon]